MAHLWAGAAAEAERYAAEAVRRTDACGYAWGAVALSWIMCKAQIAKGDFLHGDGRRFGPGHHRPQKEHSFGCWCLFGGQVIDGPEPVVRTAC
jgi:hypothetical protein